MLARTVARAELVAIVLVAIALVLLALPERVQEGLGRGANRVVLLPFAHVQSTFGGYLRLRDENARLRERLQAARLELAAAEVARRQNRELQRLLGFVDAQPVELQAARIIHRNFGAIPTTLSLDVGRRDGVIENLPVVTDGGLVGKTVSVGQATTQVMAYSHPEFSASALLLGGDHLEFGIVRPTPTGELRLFLPLRSVSGPGDRIVTSGYGGTFPRGIPIGEVDRIEQDQRLGLQKIDLVRPVVDLSRVTLVFVLRRPEPAGTSAGEIPRLFWPGYAYPPMRGESLTGTESRADSLVEADTTAVDAP